MCSSTLANTAHNPDLSAVTAAKSSSVHATHILEAHGLKHAGASTSLWRHRKDVEPVRDGHICCDDRPHKRHHTTREVNERHRDGPEPGMMEHGFETRWHPPVAQPERVQAELELARLAYQPRGVPSAVEALVQFMHAPFDTHTRIGPLGDGELP